MSNNHEEELKLMQLKIRKAGLCDDITAFSLDLHECQTLLRLGNFKDFRDHYKQNTAMKMVVSACENFANACTNLYSLHVLLRGVNPPLAVFVTPTPPTKENKNITKIETMEEKILNTSILEMKKGSIVDIVNISENVGQACSIIRDIKKGIVDTKELEEGLGDLHTSSRKRLFSNFEEDIIDIAVSESSCGTVTKRLKVVKELKKACNSLKESEYLTNMFFGDRPITCVEADPRRDIICKMFETAFDKTNHELEIAKKRVDKLY